MSTNRRTLSQRFLRVPQIDINSEVWVEETDEDGGTGDNIWVKGTVINQDNTLLTVRTSPKNIQRVIDLGFTEYHQVCDQSYPDMTSLQYIAEPTILSNLEDRSKLSDQRPYTWMGTVLTAVNPLRRIPNSIPDKNLFFNQPIDSNSPHPYAIAELALQQMKLGSTDLSSNQSIIISGESGAGKTETAKIVLDYLTSVVSSTNMESLDKKFIETGPIMEAFGNAKTLRNSNSSRFGKYMKLQFNQNTNENLSLMGGFIETYLLEKSRVVHQQEGERNFHIFYQFLSGLNELDPLIQSSLNNNNQPESYNYLNQSNCYTYDGCNDNNDFQETKEALNIIGLQNNEINELWKILSSILLLGNINITEIDSTEGEIANISDETLLINISNILGISMDDLKNLLTQRVMTTAGETYIIPLTLADAIYALNAISKNLYENIFHYIVKYINESLGQVFDNHHFIGVLDIFGFESFEHNEFEQLLINYANETLQNTFNVQVFEAELRLYEEEDIVFDTISEPPNNLDCVKLINEKTNGILSILDSISRQPKPDDEKFCKKLHDEHYRNFFFPKTHPKDKRDKFWVKHYAGNVQYTVGTWITKNNDALPQQLNDILNNSTNILINKMYSNNDIEEKNNNKRSNLKKSTVASIFNKSINLLSNTLNNTTCSFIRCIKPNPHMKVGIFDRKYVVEQLRSLGLLQTCEVLKVGLPTRITYKELKDSLSGIGTEAENLFINEPEAVYISSILWAFNVPEDVYRLGKTRVFFKAGQLQLVEKILNTNMEEIGDEILSRLQKALESRKEAKKAAELTLENINKSNEAKLNALSSMENVQKTLKDSHHNIIDNQLVSDTENALHNVKNEKENALNEMNKINSSINKIHNKDEINQLIEIINNYINEGNNFLNLAENSMNDVKKFHNQALNDNSEDLALDAWEKVSKIERLYKDVEKYSRNALSSAERCQLESTLKYQKLSNDKTNEILNLSNDISNFVMELNNEKQNTNHIWDQVRNQSINTSNLSEQAGESFHQAKEYAYQAENKINEIYEYEKREQERLKKESEENERKRKEYEENERKRKIQEENERKQREKEEQERIQKEKEEQERIQKEKEENERKQKEQQKEQMLKENRRVSIKNINLNNLSLSDNNTNIDDLKKDDNNNNINDNKINPLTLPNGWKEHFDDHYGLPFYENIITKETQWERPEEPATSKRYDSHLLQEQLEKEYEILMNENENKQKEENKKEDDNYNVVPPSSTVSEHRNSFGLSHEENKENKTKSIRSRARLSVQVVENLGMKRKEGYLLKQSKYLGRWKKRYFVLNDDLLEYYDKKSNINSGKKKYFTLTADTVTSFTDTEQCFAVRNDSQTYYLVAKDDAEMNEWIKIINAHIYAIHQRNIGAANTNPFNKKVDPYQGQGETGDFFFQVSLSLKTPIGLRLTPDVNGPRTGDGIFPGEVIPVTQIITDEKLNNLRFLRLSDDRGWVFEKKNGVFLLNQVYGTVIEGEQKYYYSDNEEVPIGIRFGPSINSQQTGDGIYPGKTITIVRSIRMALEPNQVYLELAEGGYIFVYHPGTGQQLLRKV